MALLDLLCLQQLLGGADLRLEIFHVISFLLMYIIRHWRADAVQVCSSCTHIGLVTFRASKAVLAQHHKLCFDVLSSMFAHM